MKRVGVKAHENIARVQISLGVLWMELLRNLD